MKPLIPLLLLLLLVSCSHESRRADIPRRKAYPRIEIADPLFVTVDTLPMHMPVNTRAIPRVTRRDPSGTWVDILYPDFGASVHFTFTPVDSSSLPSVIDNRLERISLNLGSQSAQMTEFETPSGLHTRLFSSPGAVSTPVQFISSDFRSVVVSGMAYIPTLTANNLDSIAPVVGMLRSDILYTLKNLRP